MSYRLLLAGDSPTPPVVVPTRDQLCTAPFTFQGLTVQTQQFGVLHWFEPCLGWFSGPTAPADRQAVYAVKRAVGDKVVQLTVSGQYKESGTDYAHIDGKDFSKDLPALRALVAEIVAEGFYVDLRLGGDGQDYDPVGMTHGHDWLMRTFPIIYGAVSDFWPWIKFNPGYDGVFYGWEPHQVKAFGQLFRSLCPDGCLALEHNTGHIPTGEGGDSYRPGGDCEDYDIIESEWDPGLPHDDNIWQIAARLLGPAYARPHDQPKDDDPGSPFGAHDSKFYLGPLNKRGLRYYAWALEWGIYDWVRGNTTPAQLRSEALYLKSVGYTLIAYPTS